MGRTGRSPRHFATVAHVTRPGIVEDPFAVVHGPPRSSAPPTAVEALVQTISFPQVLHLIELYIGLLQTQLNH
jgi:hypothetical protein